MVFVILMLILLEPLMKGHAAVKADGCLSSVYRIDTSAYAAIYAPNPVRYSEVSKLSGEWLVSWLRRVAGTGCNLNNTKTK